MKKTRRRRPKIKLRKGGSIDIPSIYVFGTMLVYGIASVILGPAYIIAEVFNAPISSINNFTRKSFNKMKPTWLHKPLYQVLSMMPEKKLDQKDFLLQDDMYIHENVAVVSLDKDPDDYDGSMKHDPSVVKDISPSGYDSFLNMFGQLNEKKKLRLAVYKLFDYIENIRATDEERKAVIKKMVNSITDYKSLIKCYLIYKTMNNICPQIKAEKKTILKNEDVITIVNPFYNPCSISYTKRLNCLKRHITQKKFNMEDPEDKVCRVSCDTCTFRNSITHLAHKYISSGAWIAALALLVSGLATLPAIAGIATPAVSMVSSGVSATASATASATGFTTSGFGTLIGGAGEMIGSIMSTAGMATAFTSGSTGAVVGGVALLSMLPPNYSAIVKQMLNAYFKNIKIINPQIIKVSDEQLIQSFPLEKVPIYKLVYGRGSVFDKPDGFVETNILAILRKLDVSVHLQGNIEPEDKEVVLEKFNRFMCKYDIMKLVEWKIANLYAERVKSYSPSQSLSFILSESMR